MTVPELDPFDGRRAVRADGLLEPFNAIGLLAAADVHVAMRLTALAGESDEAIALAAALAVRAPRHGHVFVDLRAIAETASVDSEDEEIDLSELPWPSPEDWLARLAASPLVAVGEDGFPRPAAAARRLVAVPGSLLARGVPRGGGSARVRARPPCAPTCSAAGLDRLFVGGPDDSQRAAAEAAVRRRFAVVAGGPGTGKTTTVARILALLVEQAGGVPPLVALAAPTGKAAQRLEEAVPRGRGRPRASRPRASSCSASAPPRCTSCSAARPGTNRLGTIAATGSRTRS